MNCKDTVLVKVLLKMIAEHLTSDFDVDRWTTITIMFDEHLSPKAQQVVLDNIYIPQDAQHKCSISEMADVHESLRIRTTF